MLKSATYDATKKELTLVIAVDEKGRPPREGAKLHIHAYIPWTTLPNASLDNRPLKFTATVGTPPPLSLNPPTV